MSPPPRIAHIVEHLGQGGIARVVLGVAEGMLTHGIETHILMLKDRVEFPLPQGLHCRAIPLDGLSRGSWWGGPLRRLGKHWFGQRRYTELASPWFSRQLHHALVNEHFDGLFFHGLPVVWPLHHWRGIHTRWVLHNIKSAQLQEGSPRQVQYQFQAFSRILANKPLVAVSAEVKTDLVTHFGVASEAVTVIDNPFDAAAIRERAEEPLADPLPSEYLLFVGRLAAQKRVDRLLRAYRLASLEVPLLIVGDGPLRTELEQLTVDLGLSDQVQFLGFRDNPYPYMARSLALVMSSDFEGFGNVLVEALACGTRVVSTAVGVAEVVLAGPLAAGLVPLDDEAALAVALQRAVAGVLPRGESTMLARYSPQAVAGAYLQTLGLMHE